MFVLSIIAIIANGIENSDTVHIKMNQQHLLVKGPVTGYGKLTWELAHASNFMTLCALIVLVLTAIKMVYSFVNSIPLANYDVNYDVTSIAEGAPL